MGLGAALAGPQIISGNKAAKAQVAATKEATALGREQLQAGLERTAPFLQSGASVLPELTALTNQPVEKFAYRDPAAFLENYAASPEGRILEKLKTDTLLRNQAATGGFRSGATQVGLAELVPLLGIQALQRQNQQDLTAYGTNQAANADQFQRMYGLANLGANIATGNANAGANFASQAGANAIAAGNARAGKYLNQGNAINGAMTDLLSIGLSGGGLF